MEPIIRNGIVASLTKPRNYTPSGAPRLYPSGAGKCMRQDLQRIQGKEGDPFDAESSDRMQNGVDLEFGVMRRLQDAFGADNVATQIHFQNQFWSGKADFGIHHCFDKEWNRIREDGPQPILVELKCTGSKWWDYKNNLPQRAHVIQVGLYEHFYEQKTGVKPELRLYYKGWTEWAEFIIKPQEASIGYEGLVDGVARSGSIPVNLEALMSSREFHMSRGTMPKAPDAKDFDALVKCGCLFSTKKQTKIGCPYARHCFPNGELNEHVS